MPAIDMIQGAMQGHQFVDNEIDENRREKQAVDRQAIADQRYNEERDFRRQQYADTQGYRQRQEARSQQAIDMQQSSHNQRQKIGQQRQQWAEEDREAAQFNGQMQQAIFNYQHNPSNETAQALMQLDEQASKSDNLFSPFGAYRHPESHNAALRLEPIINEIGKGNLNAANSEEGLALFNQMFAGDIKKGVGEFSYPYGATIVDKRIKEILPAPNGGLGIDLEIELDSGKVVSAPLTMNRGSDPNDRVRWIDAGAAMDNLMARHALARFTEQNQSLFKPLYDKYYGGGESGSEAGQLSATGKTVADLVHYGLSQDEAVALATKAKTDPQKAVPSLFKALNDSGQFDTPKEAYQEAQRLVMGDQDVGDGLNPKVKQIMEANPGKSQEWAEAYLQHLNNNNAGSGVNSAVRPPAGNPYHAEDKAAVNISPERKIVEERQKAKSKEDHSPSIRRDRIQLESERSREKEQEDTLHRYDDILAQTASGALVQAGRTSAHRKDYTEDLLEIIESPLATESMKREARIRLGIGDQMVAGS